MEAKKRLEKFGRNEIPEKNGSRVIAILINQIKNPLVYILIAAALIAFVFGDYFNSLIIFTVVILNSAVGFFQEFKVSNILEALKKSISSEATVLREERLLVIDAKDVVVGDIIFLKSGDKIPADGRLIRVSDLTINEAILTGESSPAEKNLDIFPETAAVADRLNMTFAGTLVESGTGEFIVTAIGTATEFGAIASSIKASRKEDVTPLQVKLRALAKTIGIIFLALAVSIFLIGVLTGREIINMFLTVVAMAVAAIPEGLPVALTITLAIGAERIFKKGGLVRKMLAAETLGSATVIAADKTATLTEGKMKLTKVIVAGTREIEDEVGFMDIAKIDPAEPEYKLFKFLALAGNAFIENPEAAEKEWILRGKPIEKAFLLGALKAGFERLDLEESMPRIKELPFSSRRRFSAVLNIFDENGNVIIAIGAPETLLERSSRYYSDEKLTMELDRKISERINNKIEDLAKDGFRVLAVAYKNVPSGTHKLDENSVNEMVFLGLAVLSDPIRPEVKEAVVIAQKAGIRPVIMTGDHKLTARHVGKQLGILKSDERLIEGSVLNRYSDKELKDIIYDFDVFARVAPEDKLKITRAYQAKGEVVAVIGDGVNDASSLVRADIGVAVGSGTDVAKEASDLILINDSFSIVVEAIKQGRIILNNIKKVTIFLLSDAFSEIVLISASIFGGLPLALLPIQMLWVKLIEDSLPSIALAFEKEHDGVMEKPPLGKGKILTRGMKTLIALFVLVIDTILLALFIWSLKKTGNPTYARTMAFLGLGMTSLFYIFSVKSLDRPIWKINIFSNPILTLSVILGLALYLMAIYVRPLQELLGVMTVGLNEWILVVLLGILSVSVVEFGKKFFIKYD